MIPIQQFLLRTTLFRFLGFGDRCNGNANHSFSDVLCDLKRLIKNRPKGQWYGIPMTVMFDSGYEFRKSLINEEGSSHFYAEQLEAWELLTKFFKEIDVHQKNILSALEKMTSSSTEKSNVKETILTMALAEHLFGKLSPGQSYLIDFRINGKDNKSKEKPYELCKCGCRKEIKLRGTGIGHEEVWHGFVDIMMMNSNEKAECVACVDSPYRNSSSNEEDEEEEDYILQSLDHMSEEKLAVLEIVKDQTAAQTVVFALAYNREHPVCNMFIPNILMFPSKFYIVMYDPVNDILVWSTEFPLFSQSTKRLQGVSIIALWMVLHYKLFCKGAEDIFENVNEIKAGFRNHLGEKHWLIYKNQLNIGVSSFNPLPHLDLVHSLCEVDYDLPKMKKLRTP